MLSPTIYVAVHAGAGHHDKDLRRVVERAIVELEDDENLNAGTGSNLTLDGTAECDAAIMDGRTSEFGSVGAVPGVKNPIKLAKAILCHSRQFDGLGRIPPLTLVSSGARSFAMQSGLETVDPESMISKRAKEDWQKWIERYNGVRQGTMSESTALPNCAIQDTVGAVAWDSCGNVAAGVSRLAESLQISGLAGGLLLKHSGRVGEAAIFGAGCWAQQSSGGKTGVACSISDVHDVLINLLTEQFYRPAVGYGISRPNAGVLLLTAESGNSKPRLWCAFTAEGMAIAYASSEKPISKATILRRPHITSGPDLPEKQPVYITALSM
ncbi:nucleophile aminohydrolase [Pisolithus marmoratus]|nr:nucleophile aminohydrolase [Pisolithus marmoratus]